MPRRQEALYALLAGALVAFVLLAVTYGEDPLETVDREGASWVADEVPTSIEWAARPLSWLGGWIGLTVLGVVTAVVLLRERAWLDLGFFLVAFVGSQLATLLVKEAFDRPRPDAGSAVPLPESSSFPSGHAAAGAASLGAVTVLLAERLPSRRARVWVWSAAVVLGAMVGLSRIALNVHYVTDVIAGWCFGLAWLGACLLVRDRVWAARRSPHELHR